MKRLYMTVEGQTEGAFVLDVLQPYLAAFDVLVAKPRFTGPHARRKGRIPKGGLLNKFLHTLGDIRRWLQEDKSADARFSMMVDLYSLPRDFPGYDEAMSLADPYEQVEQLQQALANELQDERFIPYLQLHEFEALVLSRPEVFLEWFNDVDKQVRELAKECAAFQSPELIDRGRETHPKARIIKHIVDYDENVDGPILAVGTGLEVIRDKCPHFSRWLTLLEDLDRGEQA